MIYKELLNRYFKNLNNDSWASKEINQARTDYGDTLKEMYLKAEVPKTKYALQVTELKDVIEDFSDSTYIDGFTIGAGFTYNSSTKVIEATINASVVITGLTSISTVDLAIGGVNAVDPITNFASAEIIITDELGNTLYDTTIDFTHPEAHAEILSFTPGISGENLKMSINFVTTADYTSYYVDSITYQMDYNSILLPSDFFLPLQVILKATDGSIYASNEMPYERYERWEPNSIINNDATTQVTDPETLFATSENEDYDRTIGYFFNATTKGTTFNWKPTFAGEVIIIYAYIPTASRIDTDTIEVNPAFIETLTDGATYRGLKRKIQKAKSDVELNAYVISYREYKASYRDRLIDFVGFTKATAEPIIMKPNDFLNDPDMLPN